MHSFFTPLRSHRHSIGSLFSFISLLFTHCFVIMSTFGRSQVAAPRAPAATTLRQAQTSTYPDSPLLGVDFLDSPLTPLPERTPMEPSIQTEDTQRPPTPSPAPRPASPQPPPPTRTLRQTLASSSTAFSPNSRAQLLILQELRVINAPAPEPLRTEPPAIPAPPPNPLSQHPTSCLHSAPTATNTFAACDLYKLDKDIKTRGNFNKMALDNGYFIACEREATNKDYPTLCSILEIMVIYRGDRAASARFTHSINTYRDDLYMLYLEFNWTAVFEYHFKFHANRIVDMEQGVYGGWGERNTILLNRHLFGKPEGPSDFMIFWHQAAFLLEMLWYLRLSAMQP
ncbi:hypothetical protein M422DRAFT_257272 [Sphaerobolus stellatus SS14]|uniref:Uncharacterized protein n=1 Tax=Sphaerobolus stellatus (strain SS14) TaxID=990650 RepID=A0A0C9VPA7_SPHS4|nr:hypothetical protein M422DRAFT_257272 [Sphaerobolus stellatus SS14]